VRRPSAFCETYRRIGTTFEPSLGGFGRGVGRGLLRWSQRSASKIEKQIEPFRVTCHSCSAPVGSSAPMPWSCRQICWSILGSRGNFIVTSAARCHGCRTRHVVHVRRASSNTSTLVKKLLEQRPDVEPHLAAIDQLDDNRVGFPIDLDAGEDSVEQEWGSFTTVAQSRDQ